MRGSRVHSCSLNFVHWLRSTSCQTTFRRLQKRVSLPKRHLPHPGSRFSFPPASMHPHWGWQHQAPRVPLANCSHWYVASPFGSRVTVAPDAPILSSLSLTAAGHCFTLRFSAFQSNPCCSVLQNPVEEIKLKGSILANSSASWQQKAAALLAVSALVTSDEFDLLRHDQLKYAQILDLLQLCIFPRVSVQVCAGL